MPAPTARLDKPEENEVSALQPAQSLFSQKFLISNDVMKVQTDTDDMVQMKRIS